MKKNYLLLLLALCVTGLSAQVQNQWVWVNGTDYSEPAHSGLIGIEDASNWPGGRINYEGHADASGKFWIYEGVSGFPSQIELWVYDPVTGNFTCKKGFWGNAVGYNKGTGIEYFGNYPPVMSHSQSWMDNEDNLWLFSGIIENYNNSIWKYNNLSGNWVEVKASTEGAVAVYGTMGTPSADNVPPGVCKATTWKDNDGNFWLYGGNLMSWSGNGSFNQFSNSLWKFNVETEQWTWVWGSQEFNQLGSYSQLGVESEDNNPGSRESAEGWVDSEGNLWLYGGRGPHEVSESGTITWMEDRNDVWKFNTSTGLWTWVKGNDLNEGPIMITQGEEDPLNLPGGMGERITSWTTGNYFWTLDQSQQLWRFNTETLNWAMINIPESTGQPPVYGELGVGADANDPGMRKYACGWVDQEGDLCFFSGLGDLGEVKNDVWKYDISEDQWVWIDGCGPVSACPKQAKFEGMMHPDVSPGGNSSQAAEWTDSEGNLWVFNEVSLPYLNSHMWKYNSTVNQWQWKDGRFTSVDPEIPVAGIESDDINPMYRETPMTWTDADDNLWLYGGGAYPEYKNDLWKYNTLTNNWTMVKGPFETNVQAVYGTQGVAAPGNTPGARTQAVTWTDNDGNLWLFGGYGKGISDFFGELSDLWKYNIATSEWIWMKGSQDLNAAEVDNGLGVIDATSTPKYYFGTSTPWSDNDGNLWIFNLAAVWKYDIAGDVWIKVSEVGDLNYGNLNVADVANSPGIRLMPLVWSDSNGDLILYGGTYTTGEPAQFVIGSDLWKYSISSGLWAWIGGDDTTNVAPSYGEINMVNYYNNPGGRYAAITWTDNNGNRMFFSGQGYDPDTVQGYKDVWKFTGAFNTVTGTIKFDSDANGCQPGDISASNIKVNFTDGTNPGFVFTDENGSYTLFADSGEVTITAESDTFTVSPASQTFSFDGYQNTETLDFCLTAPTPVNDLEVTVIPVDQARPGFDANYKLVYTNKGTTTLSGTVQFDYDDAVLDFVSADTAPTFQSTGLLEWNYASLAPFQSAEVNIVLNINSPMETPAVNGGDILAYTATVSPVTGDATQGDNTFALNQEVVNSLDPNDKTCLQGETITEDMVGDYVTYLIRFENTGTANAINVIVEDVIDISKFDIASIQPLAASHNYRLEVTEGNVATFIFEGIQLQFGEDNPLRHGFVSFRIKTLPTLVEGDIFDNTADIYFDYNFPVITNTAQTSIEENVNGTEDFGTSLSWYPNPVKDRLTLSDDSFEKAVVYDMAGRIIMSTHMAGNTVNLEHLSAGVYIVKLSSGNKSASIKIIKE